MIQEILLCFFLLFSIYDPNYDYSKFLGRITDRNTSANTLKIKVEDPNIRFLRAGDPVRFRIPTMNPEFCQAYIQDVQLSNGNYIVVYTGDIKVCWKDEHILRRGTQLSFLSPILHQRVQAAEQMRQVFLQQKQDFLLQLNTINNYLYTFSEQMTHEASRFDEKLDKIQKEKQQALDQLLNDKETKIKLQKELVKKVEWLKDQIKFHQVDRYEPLVDRWSSDLKTGLPVVPKEKNPPD